MRKPFILLISIAILIGATYSFAAQPYKSNSVPSDELILAAIDKNFSGLNKELLGKIKQSDDSYSVFIRIGGDKGIGGMPLYKLDSNLWVIRNFSDTSYSLILTK